MQLSKTTYSLHRKFTRRNQVTNEQFDGAKKQTKYAKFTKKGNKKDYRLQMTSNETERVNLTLSREEKSMNVLSKLS